MSEDAVERLMVKSFTTFIINSIEGVMKCLDGFDEQQLNWRPPAAESNSLYVIANHVLQNSQENLLKILGGQATSELPIKGISREEIFSAQGNSPQLLYKEWQVLKQEIIRQLNGLSDKELNREIEHPRRGCITVHDILLAVTSHMAEHLGHAELTRDMVKRI
ncbi:MAG: DinB family protein [Chloroflexi bacterium]|nr:DinB family protein [Chloroflexota bacterium]OJV90046.1 MAG: hypothetical protein BGO39_01315 [Chloroflexi bacterium 54-19]